MAAGSSNSAAGVLVKLLIHPVMNRTMKLTIPLVSFRLPQDQVQVLLRPARRQSQRVKHGMEIAAVPQL